jgi:hypothetical protein
LNEAVTPRKIIRLQGAQDIRGRDACLVGAAIKLHRGNRPLPGAGVDDHRCELPTHRRKAFHRNVQQPTADHVGVGLRSIREVRVPVDEHTGRTPGRKPACDGLEVAQKDLIAGSPEVLEGSAAGFRCPRTLGQGGAARRKLRQRWFEAAARPTDCRPVVAQRDDLLVLELERREAPGGELLHHRWFQRMVVGQRGDEKCRTLCPHPRDIPYRRLHVPIIQLHPKLLPRERQHDISQESRHDLLHLRFAREGDILGALAECCDVVDQRHPFLVPSVDVLRQDLAPGTREGDAARPPDERRRPIVEAMSAEANLMPVFGVHLAVCRQPVAGASHLHASIRRGESRDDTTGDGRKQQPRILIAWNEHHPVRARARKSTQRLNVGIVSLHDPVQPTQSLRLRAADPLATGGAGSRTRIDQLEHIAVHYQIDGVVPLLSDRVEKAAELRGPPEIFGGMPRGAGRPAEAHVQVADDDDGSDRDGLREGHIDRRRACGEAENEYGSTATAHLHDPAAREKRTISRSLRTTMCLLA